MQVRGAVLVGGLGALLFGVLAACGSSNGAGNGGECFVATDCQAPLVCVEQKDKTRRCSDNLDSIVGEIPPEAGPPMGDAGQQAEASTDSGGSSSSSSGGPQDSGPPPKDSGSTDQ